MTNLMSALWDRADEGENYDCTEEQISMFICLRMDDGHFTGDPTTFDYKEVEVEDNTVDGWVDQFKIWLKEG